MSTRERKQVDTYKPTVSEPKKRPKKAAAPKEKAVKASKKAEKEDKPKKANAYMLFATATRPDVVKKNPDSSFGEVGKLVGALWTKLKEGDKAEWKKKADVQTAKNLKEFNAKAKN